MGLWLVCASAAQAGIQAASDPIFNSRAQTLLESVQGGGTDLPLSLQTSRDVYLFITAGAAYTEVRALALPLVPPQRLAQALAASTAGTALAGRTVTWSADDYSAALVQEGHGQLLARSAANTVPVGALVTGLRRAGFAPHTLLRVPLYASGVSLPPPRHRARAFNWYDQRQVAGMGSVHVRASLSGTDIGLLLFFLIFVAAVGMIGLLAVVRVARDERLPAETRRQRLKALPMNAILGVFLLYTPLMMAYLRTQHPLAVSDLWFSSSTPATLVPFLAPFPAILLFLMPIATRRLETRHLGPAPVAAPISMSPEETAIRQRMARWSALPHLAAVVGVAVGLFLLPRKSPLYPVLHPLAQILPVVGAAVIARLFRRPLAAFTCITPDDDLTWRARQLGMQMGARPQEVRVEDSSKAAHYATITNEGGGRILVSRKLLEAMSRDELEFLLAHQVALMQVKVPLTPLMLLPVLPAVLPIAFAAWILTGHRATTLFSLMPYLIPLMLLPLLATLFLSRRGATLEARRALAADRAALAVTRNVAAAQSALMKLASSAPASPGEVAGMGALPPSLAARLKALAEMPPSAAGLGRRGNR
ncbi:MAG: M48 family metalloprotease [Armatimonadetes bacterium]|nr:M48 family metalloprotease [Armatimonadota bacterium]